jgi:hypothetical protein
MKYFDFYKLQNMGDNAEVFFWVAAIYAIIFSVSWLYTKVR